MFIYNAYYNILLLSRLEKNTTFMNVCNSIVFFLKQSEMISYTLDFRVLSDTDTPEEYLT